MKLVKVRCTLNRDTLWFHVDGQIASRHLTPDFRKGSHGRIENMDQWKELTPLGRTIVEELMELGEVKSVGGSIDNFTVTVFDEASWPSVLSHIRYVLRTALQDRQLKLVQHPNSVSGVEQWHLPLLARLG